MKKQIHTINGQDVFEEVEKKKNFWGGIERSACRGEI